MITASNDLKNVFYNSTSVTMNTGCTFEYNMNSMLDNIAVTTTSLDSDYIAQVNVPDGDVLRINPFKKLFPVDSIVKPFRPTASGIKYYIFGDPSNDVVISGSNKTYKFSSPRIIEYPSTQARIYYPGVTTTYKYWVTPIGDNADITVTYSNGSTKYAVTNKIVVKFEKYHDLPSNYTLTITKSDNSTVSIGPYSPDSSGGCSVYYNGTSWSNTAPAEPITYANPISIKSIRLQATNSSASKVIGVVELSARWIKDVSADIVTMAVRKESSSRADTLLPVGDITSNSFRVEMAKYNEDNLKIKTYDRSSTDEFDSDVIYLTKNMEVVPHVKVYHANGAITSGSNKYDKVTQGIFYADYFSISEYGDATVNCLDVTKYLMETIAPELLCEGYSVTAILRYLLDSVGFTSYKFNLHATTETSIPVVQYWWTDGSKTVWDAIQELCRDIQMNAFVDEYGVLQFYSRDYMYSRTTADWGFYYDEDGSIKPNIVSFTPEYIPSANQVKVLWQSPVKTAYVGSSGGLWDSPTTFLSAGGLKYPIEANTSAANTVLMLEFSTIDQYIQQQALFNYNGYVMIDSEIIEFDAIQFQYTPNNSNTPQAFWATSPTDLAKYKYISRSGYADPTKPETAFFKPTGRYRVKTRGALGTTPAYHSATSATVSADWNQVTVNWS
jgi:hypothetical protein